MRLFLCSSFTKLDSASLSIVLLSFRTGFDYEMLRYINVSALLESNFGCLVSDGCVPIDCVLGFHKNAACFVVNFLREENY